MLVSAVVLVSAVASKLSSFSSSDCTDENSIKFSRFIAKTQVSTRQIR